ncbi:NUDIX domain-containing protein [Paraglaciecola sp.]|uniref:NUDIX hydrolase n=1 Tax=Paraglaciecola sp. TaxID=1920173 RepID=UPI0030F3A780
MLQLNNNLRFCPQCGAQGFSQRCEKSLVCSECGFTYFHNVAATVTGFIFYQDKLLLVKRGQQPCLGMLDLPGGFVDPNESNEQALIRELQEELQLRVDSLQYMFSFPNHYCYKEVSYPTLDSFFMIKLDALPELTIQQAELSGYCWLEPSEIDPEALAFDSHKKALATCIYPKSLELHGGGK